MYWFVFTIAINPFRWKWAPFVLMGIGAGLPRSIVETEDRLREWTGREDEIRKRIVSEDELDGETEHENDEEHDEQKEEKEKPATNGKSAGEKKGKKGKKSGK